MDGKASEATDSVNARIMQLLHPTWINMGGYFNDGAGHGYVTPDFEGSVDASLAALDPARRNLQVVLRYNVYEKRSECMLLKTGGGQRAHVCTRYGEKDDDYALAAAHALEALLLATAKEDAG